MKYICILLVNILMYGITFAHSDQEVVIRSTYFQLLVVIIGISFGAVVCSICVEYFVKNKQLRNICYVGLALGAIITSSWYIYHYHFH